LSSPTERKKQEVHSLTKKKELECKEEASGYSILASHLCMVCVQEEEEMKAVRKINELEQYRLSNVKRQ
jgi:hypothetical protein